MKIIRCDHCKTEVPTESLYGNPPAGWVTTSRAEQPDLHFCVPLCASEHFKAEADRQSHTHMFAVR